MRVTAETITEEQICELELVGAISHATMCNAVGFRARPDRYLRFGAVALSRCAEAWNARSGGGR